MRVVKYMVLWWGERSCAAIRNRTLVPLGHRRSPYEITASSSGSSSPWGAAMQRSSHDSRNASRFLRQRCATTIAVAKGDEQREQSRGLLLAQDVEEVLLDIAGVECRGFEQATISSAGEAQP